MGDPGHLLSRGAAPTWAVPTVTTAGPVLAGPYAGDTGQRMSGVTLLASCVYFQRKNVLRCFR